MGRASPRAAALKWLAALALGWQVVLGAGPAAGQTVFDKENVGVQDRPRPEYEPIGIRAGAFVVHPEIAVSAAGNDNVTASQVQALTDAVFAVHAQVAVKSDWDQNAVSLSASTALTGHAAYPKLNAEEHRVSAAGVLDVRHDLTVDGEAALARQYISPASDAYLGSPLSPLFFSQASARIGAAEELTHIRLTTDFKFDNFTYSDGVTARGRPISESFRDRDTYKVDIRGDYAVSPALGVFVEQTFAHNDYNRAKFRDQNSEETLVGPKFEITNLLTGELAVGYLSSSFSDRRAKREDTVHWRGKVVYYATPLIDITLSAREGFFDSGVPNSPAYLNKNAEIRVDYELLRNLIITGSFTGDWNEYRAIDRHDHYYDARFGATYLANRGMELNLVFNRLTRSSSGALATTRLADDVLTLTLTLKA